jgi:hypothetical protein
MSEGAVAAMGLLYRLHCKASVAGELKLRYLENPTEEVKSSRSIYGLAKVNTLSDPPKRYAPPEKKDRYRDQGHGAKECEYAERIGEKCLPEVEPNRPREASSKSATGAGQMRQP